MRKGESIDWERVGLCSRVLEFRERYYMPWIRAPKRANPWGNDDSMLVSSFRGRREGEGTG